MKAIISLRCAMVNVDLVNSLGGLVSRRRFKDQFEALAWASQRRAVAVVFE